MNKQPSPMSQRTEDEISKCVEHLMLALNPLEQIMFLALIKSTMPIFRTMPVNVIRQYIAVLTKGMECAERDIPKSQSTEHAP